MPAKTESLSIQHARKLVLHSQQLPHILRNGSSLSASLAVIEHLGYIQIDTISVIQRAHHHTLWTRNPRYEDSHINQLMISKQVFEYWSHAAAYLPMRDFRYSLIRKNALAEGVQNHWYVRDEQLMKSVLKRIAAEGPLMSKDFDHGAKKENVWTSKPAKRALEYLFMQGELMIPYRKNFQKVYELTERVLPEDIDTSIPNPEEYARHLITRFLEANGIGQVAEITYLLKGVKKLVTDTIRKMLLSNELVEVAVDKLVYVAIPSSLELLNKSLPRMKLRILSPFDNLLIQRKRMLSLFSFDYQLECYLPEKSRKFGYFSLPILWDGNLVGRMDCKTDRKTSSLHIQHLATEAKLKKTDDFLSALSKELTPFMKFNGCNNLIIHTTSPISLKPALLAIYADTKKDF